jgi:hypothetical protein
LDLQLPVKSVPIATKIAISTPVYSEISKFEIGGFGLWCLTPLLTIFQLYRGGKFFDGGNRRKPPACHKSLTNFITYI